MTLRDFARRALRRLALPVPQRDRTLNVYVEDAHALPAWGIRCTCPIAVNHVWRAAHENGCTKIVIHNGPQHHHEFDTVDFLKRFTIARLGFLPRPFSIAGKTPRLLATTGHRALGNTFDVTKPTFHVPTAVSGAGVAGGKELVHGRRDN